MNTGDSLQLVVYVWRGKLAYHVLVNPKGGRKYIAARGVTDREIEPVLDTYGRGLMDAAYEAYRDLGE